ncbi:MAG: sugar acetyltransferase [Actinomycetota bacterium]
MTTDRPLVIAAATGAIAEVVGVIRQPAGGTPRYRIVGVLDVGDGHSPLVGEIAGRLGVPLFGGLSDIPAGADIALSGGSQLQRTQLIEEADARGLGIATLIHADTTVGPWVDVGLGSMVFAGARLTGNITVGAFCQLHTGTVVSHDDVLGDHVTLSPSATLCGGVTIGDRSTVFAGATVMPGVTIGAEATVGAGALVNRDVAPGATVVGVPAKPLAADT